MSGGDSILITSASELETSRLARTLATVVPVGSIVCLEGELGAGKTRFARGIAEGLGVDPAQVSSPTYTLVHDYPVPDGTQLTHMDAYRLDDSETDDLETLLGWPSGAPAPCRAIIEWPSHIRHLLPPDAIWITIQHAGPQTRTIEIKGPPELLDSLRRALQRRDTDG